MPGMGETILFSYTIVLSLGFTWQEALAIVFVSGVIFTVVSFTPFANTLTNSIPSSLKHGITVGIGLFITFIGLQKGGLIVANEETIIGLGDITNITVLLTIITLILAVVLFVYNVKGGFLISLVIGTCIALPFGLTKIDYSYNIGSLFTDYQNVFGAFSFERVFSFPFWTAVFSLTMILLFQNLGMIQSFEKDDKKFKLSYQATGASNVLAGVFGTSPTVAALESAVGITEGARTGLSSVVVGVLFLTSIIFMPIINIIPDNAVAPILIIIGSLMLQSIKEINFEDFSDYLPAFLIVIMTPLTYNIADGIAFGFISYPIIKVLCGKAKELNTTICAIGALFVLNYLFLT